MNTKRVVNGVLVAAIVATGVVGWQFVSTSSTASAQSVSVVTAKKGTVLTSVTGTGNITAPSQLDLSFDSAIATNKVVEIKVKAGDQVTPGQEIAKVDPTSAQVALTLAQAQLAQAQAALTKAKSPLTSADYATDASQKLQAQNAVTSAQVALTTAQANQPVDQKLQDAAVAAAQTAFDAATPSNQVALQNALDKAKADRDKLLASDQAAIDSANRQLGQAQASLTSTLASIAVKEKAVTDADVVAQNAAVVQAQNSVTTAQRNLDNTTLVAPFTGTIAALSGKVGAAGNSTGSTGSGASASSSAFATLTDFTQLEAKVGFSEADAAKVQPGLAATVTLDSITGVTLTGKVRAIDSLSTTVSNVVTYYAYVTLDPIPATAPVKPGMTASVAVVVTKADGVVYLPNSAITARGTNATVNVELASDPKKTKATPVTVGLKGDDSMEITSGLKEGDKVVVVRTTTSGVGTSTNARIPGAATAVGGGFTGAGPAARPGG